MTNLDKKTRKNNSSASSRVDKATLCSYPLIPTSARILILCESQKGASLINSLLTSPLLISVHLPPQSLNSTLYLQTLKKQFDSEIYTIFDKTRNLEGESLGTKYGFNVVEFSRVCGWRGVSQFDSVEECLDSVGKKLTIEILLTCLATSINVPDYPDDPDSIAVPLAYKLEFDRYLGEEGGEDFGLTIKARDILEQMLASHPKIVLQSGAGTGKSTWLIHLANSGLVEGVLGLNHLVIVQPKTSIEEQLYKSFENIKGGLGDEYRDEEGFLKSGSLAFVDGNSDPDDIGLAQSSRVIVCTYDSLPKLAPILEKSLGVVDEFQEIAKDQSYRAEAMNAVWELIQLAPRKILISATPNYLFCTDLLPEFNYKLIVGNSQTPNTFDVEFVPYKCPQKELALYIEENAPNGGGTVCIKWDHTKILEANNNYFKGRGYSSTFINSDRKSKSPDYKSIMDNGEPVNPLDFLGYTKIFESGVSFKFPVKQTNFVGLGSWQEIIQVLNRPRINEKEGFNIHNVARVYYSDKERNKGGSIENIKSRFIGIHQASLSFCKELDQMGSGAEQHHSSSDLKTTTYKKVEFCPMTEREETSWKVNVPAILQMLYNQETGNCSLELLKKRIERFDSRFSCSTTPSIETIDNHAKSHLLGELEIIEGERKEKKDNFIELLNENFQAVVNAVCYLSKDRKLKESARTKCRVGAFEKDQTKNFIESHYQSLAYSNKGKSIKTICALLDAGYSTPKALKAISTLSDSELKQTVSGGAVKKRHSTYLKSPEKLSAKDKMECKIDKAITKTLDQIRYNAKKRKYANRLTKEGLCGLTKEELCNYVNLAVYKLTKTHKFSLSNAKSISRIKTLYELEIERKIINDKKTTIYGLGERKIKLDRGV